MFWDKFDMGNTEPSAAEEKMRRENVELESITSHHYFSIVIDILNDELLVNQRDKWGNPASYKIKDMDRATSINTQKALIAEIEAAIEAAEKSSHYFKINLRKKEFFFLEERNPKKYHRVEKSIYDAISQIVEVKGSKAFYFGYSELPTFVVIDGVVHKFNPSTCGTGELFFKSAECHYASGGINSPFNVEIFNQALKMLEREKEQLHIAPAQSDAPVLSRKQRIKQKYQSQENRDETKENYSYKPATVSGVDSPFAVLAALKKGR